MLTSATYCSRQQHTPTMLLAIGQQDGHNKANVMKPLRTHLAAPFTSSYDNKHIFPLWLLKGAAQTTGVVDQPKRDRLP